MTIRAGSAVRTAAIEVAADRVASLLADCPGIAANLERAGAELHVIGEHEAVTDLPQYVHMRGVPFDGDATMDERGRGYGGLHACTSEESLLELPSARHRDHRDVCSHELAHTVFAFGLDAALRARVEQRYRAALAEGLWPGAYAATNVHEFFAELTMWFVGSRGDFGAIPGARAGRTWLRGYDPASEALLTALYTGVLVPEPLIWDDLQATEATRSLAGAHATSLVIHNELDHDLACFWLGYDGVEHPYGLVPAGGLRSLDTYATHPWILVGKRRWGPFVPGAALARVRLSRSIA